MQILIDEEKRAGGYAPDGMEWEYPDPRWQIVTAPDEVVESWTEDMVHYRWDGEKFIYDPKRYEEE